MRALGAFVGFAALHILAAPVVACTCFCFDGPEGPIFGSNLDIPFPGDGLVFINPRGVAKEGLQGSPNGEKAKWVSKYGSVTFNLAGREFAFGGMNEAGLVVGSMQLLASEYPELDERTPLTIGTWAQYVLDTCDDIDDVLELDSRVRIEDAASPTHYLVADADGNCAAIEWLDGQLVYHAGETLPVKAMSNMRYGRALAALERGGPRWWWSNPGRSAERFAAAADRNKRYDAARDGDPVSYAFGTLTEIVVAPDTRWSIVYDIAKREVWFGSRQSRTGKHLSLAAFDLSCDAPLLMLDVNAKVEGNIEDLFTPYDREVNFRVFRTLCDRYGLDVSEATADAVMRHFDTFECAR